MSSFAWLVELHVEHRLKQRQERVSERDADHSPSAAAGGGGGGGEGAQGGAARGGRGVIQFSHAAHSAGETLTTLGRGLMMSQMPWLNQLTRRGLK